MSGRIDSTPQRSNSINSWGSKGSYRSYGANRDANNDLSYISASTNFKQRARTRSLNNFSRSTSRASSVNSNPTGSIARAQSDEYGETVLSANSGVSISRFETPQARTSRTNSLLSFFSRVTSRGSSVSQNPSGTNSRGSMPGVRNSASTYNEPDDIFVGSNHTYSRRGSLPVSITSIQESLLEDDSLRMPDVETVPSSDFKAPWAKDFLNFPPIRNSPTFPSPIVNRKKSSKSEIVLRKYFENGKWFEEAHEVTSRIKRNGSTDKTFRSNVRQLENDEVVGMENSEDIIKQLNLETDLNNQRIVQQGKGIMQDDREEFSREVLQTMNIYRYRHGLAALKIEPEISEFARAWARSLAKTGDIRSRNKVDLGDSIYVKTSDFPWEKISGGDVVDKWYEEINNFNFSQPSEVSSGNFSQIVWKNTKNIGVGVERSKNGLQTYVVVFFHPKGNIPGAFRENVPPIGGFGKLNRNDKGIKISTLPDAKEDFPKAILKTHNFYRLKHSASPLVLDQTLSKYSQEWAEKLAEKDKLQHRSNNIYGENIYRTSFHLAEVREIPGSEPVSFWYNKSSNNYNFKLEPKDLRTAPFTQLIWSDTRDLGVGIAKSRTNQFYVVVNYNPPGNLLGQFTKKVLPLKWNAA